MWIDSKRKKEMEDFVLESIVDELVHNIDDEEEKEKVETHYRILLLARDEIGDYEEQISTMIIMEVLKKTLETFKEDFEIVNKQMEADGRTTKKFNKDKFHLMYKKFLCEALEIVYNPSNEKEKLVVFRKKLKKTGEWFFGWSISVEMVLALAEYYNLYYCTKGLKEVEKFEKEYEKYSYIYGMREQKNIYRWEYRLLVERNLKISRIYNIEAYDNPENKAIENLYDNYVDKLSKKIDDEKKYFMPEIFDLRDNMEQIKAFVNDTINSRKNYSMNAYLYGEYFELLNRFNKDISALVGDYKEELEDIREENSKQYIKDNSLKEDTYKSELIKRFKEIIKAGNNSIEMSDRFKETLYNLIVNENDEEEVNKIFSSLGGNKLSELKDKLISAEIINDVKWGWLIDEIAESYDYKNAKFILDTVLD